MELEKLLTLMVDLVKAGRARDYEATNALFRKLGPDDAMQLIGALCGGLAATTDMLAEHRIGGFTTGDEALEALAQRMAGRRAQN